MKLIFSKTIAIIMLAFASLASAEYRLLDQVIAVVEDDVVLASEVREQLFQFKRTLRQRGQALPDDSILYEQILERAILERLQLQRADRMGLRVTDQTLNDAMTRIAEGNGLSLSDFRRALIENGESYVDLRENIRRDLLLREVQQRNVIRTININKSEVESFLASERGKALVQPEWQVDHILLEVSDFDDSREVADKRAEIERLQEAAVNAGNFQQIVEEIRRAEANYLPLGWLDTESIPTLFSNEVEQLKKGEISKVIESESGFHLIMLADVKGGALGSIQESKVRHILVSETAIRDYEQGKELIEEVRNRVLNGEDFRTLAREFSDDPGSALSGGDLGWVEPGVMVETFDAMMADVELKAVSPVFRSQFGWHILEVLERRERDAFEERSRQLARQKIAESKYDDALQNWLQELRDDAYVEIK